MTNLVNLFPKPKLPSYDTWHSLGLESVDNNQSGVSVEYRQLAQ
jgi:hypothetical protein